MSTRVRPIKETSKPDKSTKYQRLKNNSWGIGIEHEMHVFHSPTPEYQKAMAKGKQKKEHLNEFIVYDSWDSVINILKNRQASKYSITPLQERFLSNIPFEQSGRKCKGEWVLRKIDFKMPELITENPFSSLKEGKRSMESYCRQIQDKENEFINILVDYDKLNKNKIKNYGGRISTYPFGLCSFIKEPKSYKAGKYQFKSGLVKDYTGSYHITMTLPYTEKTTEKEFIKMHQNFANQLQWIEPLLLTAFFSSDDTSVGTYLKKVRGSFRVMRVGWGNLAGSDIRKFDVGIGRYSNIKTYWREGLDFYNIKKLKACSKVTIQEPGAISALSSNFRTFGATDPDNPDERKSGSPMTIPNGIEFRIFDHFPSEYLQELCKILVFVAENSRKHQTKKYVYQNKSWIEAVKQIMKYGWKAMLPESYIKELRNVLNLKINTTKLRAYEIFQTINTELFQKNKNGDWTYLMLEPQSLKKAPILPKINQRSWELGFLIKMNRNKSILKSWNLILRSIKNYTTFTMKEFEDMFYRAFNKNNWSDNIEDVIYFLEDKDYVDVIENSKGEIVKFKVTLKDIREWDNDDVDAFIRFEWTRHFLKNISNKLDLTTTITRLGRYQLEGKPLASQ